MVTKNRPGKIPQAGITCVPGLFSDLFNVAASRPAQITTGPHLLSTFEAVLSIPDANLGDNSPDCRSSILPTGRPRGPDHRMGVSMVHEQISLEGFQPEGGSSRLDGLPEIGQKGGLFPRQIIQAMQQRKMIQATVEIEAAQLQPASLDLRLGARAYRVRAGKISSEPT
jgi:hypothetical protein